VAGDCYRRAHGAGVLLLEFSHRMDGPISYNANLELGIDEELGRDQRLNLTGLLQVVDNQVETTNAITVTLDRKFSVQRLYNKTAVVVCRL